MNIAMMQPAFLPWQGYFELIYKSQGFIFLDDFQFSVQSYQQRNHLFVNKGQVGWYSVPVKKAESFKSPINRTKISESIPWRKKMWKRIEQNYSKATYFSEISPLIKKWLFTQERSLAAQNISFIRLVCRLLNFEREFWFSSQRPSCLRRSKRVLELIQWRKADRYFAAKGSFGYMLEDGVFPVEGIEVLFQDYHPKPHAQVGAKDHFEPNLSVLDALMNIGSEATADLIKNGTPCMLSWESMCSMTQLQPTR
jgi:hypothetical protein